MKLSFSDGLRAFRVLWQIRSPARLCIERLRYPCGQSHKSQLNCSNFKPIANKPNGDYVLTNMGVYGKEGKLTAIKTVAVKRVRVKVFVDFSTATEALTRRANARCLGEAQMLSLLAFTRMRSSCFSRFRMSHSATFQLRVWRAEFLCWFILGRPFGNRSG